MSPYGKIESSWEVKDDVVFYQCEIPANTAATLILPNGNIKEGNRNIKEAADITIPCSNSKKIILELGSGSYRFVIRQE